MAKNDIVIIDNIINQIKEKNEKTNIGQIFESFCIEQLLKDYDLSLEQISSGFTDGNNDGGIDGLYIFINGNYLEDIESFNWPKSSCDIQLIIVSAKHHDTFTKSLLDDQYGTICEFFNLSLQNELLKANYNEELLYKETLFIEAYRKIYSNLISMAIDFFYVSRGDSSIVGENILAKSNQITSEISEFFSECKVSYKFYGSSEILALYRKNKDFKLKLNYSRILNHEGGSFVVLCSLQEYVKLITFDDGKLKKYLFDSNVRSFMGFNRVNEDILNSLVNKTDIDFWWLNNGITLLSTGSRDLGSFIEIDNAQIVNGLQTSETIYYYFKNHTTNKTMRNVLIKIISNVNIEVRDEIIKATNNQTSIALPSLHATDKIQRDIEDVMFKHGLFYERRINYYYNQGKEANTIFSPLYLASGFIALIDKNLISARSLKQKFMNNENLYNYVFNEKNSLNIWPKIATILRKTDNFIETKRTENGSKCYEGFLKSTRYIVSFLAVSKIIGDFNFTIKDLEIFDLELLNNTVLNSVWNLITENNTKQYDRNSWRKKDFIVEQLRNVADALDIKNLDSILLRKFKFNDDNNKNPYMVINNEVLELVNNTLPKQPWKPGTSYAAAKQLKLNIKVINQAIAQLIQTRKRYRQKDGIVYDENNNILLIDEERVDKTTLKLVSDD